jgi:cytochrome c oxidase subunit 2
VATEVDLLYWFIAAVSAFFVVLVAALVVGFTIKYRRRHDDQVGADIHGSLVAELTWTFIPLVLSLIFFFWGADLAFRLARPPVDAMEIFVVGKQWMWKIQHPTGQREINTLHVPVGTAIRLTQTSEDVIHSFFVPAFRIKKDAVPGRYTQQWFQATKKGTFRIFCAEYCGSKHSEMIGWVTVMDQDEYQRWLANTPTGELPEESGRKLFEAMRCISCHTVEPGASQIQGATARGPSMVGLFGREVALTNGRKVVVTDEYIRESILNPAAKITAGYADVVMPSYEGQLGEEEILQINAYIKSLKEAAPKGTGTQK